MLFLEYQFLSLLRNPVQLAQVLPLSSEEEIFLEIGTTLVRLRLSKLIKKISAVGKAEFFPLEAIYIELKASTANISYVRSVVQE